MISISSVAGFMGFQGSGYYAASKHAVEGWSDALALEGKPLGIKVTLPSGPGHLRTDWAGRSVAAERPAAIADYAETAASRMAMTTQRGDDQPGDPVRAAQAIIDIAGLANHAAPLRVLGALGIENVTQNLKARLAEIEAWREVRG